jgi:biotin transporter BioY
MIKPFITVDVFSLGRAAGLVVFTATTGYVIGWLFAVLWNRAHR